MKEIVKINQVALNGNKINAVNARELWQALESKQEFANWIKARIEKLNLVKGRDYEVFDNIIKNDEGGGRPAIDYVVTLDIAKHFAMLEMTDRGSQVREYFIECEKQLQNQFKAPTTLLEALELAVEQQKQILKLEAQNQSQAHCIEYQKGVLQNYKEVEKSYRHKAELAKRLNDTIRLYAQQKLNKDYGLAYNTIYGLFAKRHHIKEKINMAYLKKNIDYLAECLSIVSAELDLVDVKEIL